MTFKDKRKLRPTQKPSSPPAPRHTWGRSKVPPAEGRAGRVPPTPTCPWPCAGPALLCVLLLWTAPRLSPAPMHPPLPGQPSCPSLADIPDFQPECRSLALGPRGGFQPHGQKLPEHDPPSPPL